MIRAPLKTLLEFLLKSLGPLAVGAALALFAASPAWAACAGKDLLAHFKAEHPDYHAKLEREAATFPYSRGKLFRLSRHGTSPSYLFGTAHVTDPRATTFSTTMRTALDRARIVALELKESEDVHGGSMFAGVDSAALLRLILARAEERADRFLSAAELARLEKALPAYGMPASAARSFRPSVLAVTIAIPACASRGASGAKIVDAVIAEIGRKAGKPVIGLETITEQLAAMADFPFPVQKQLLVSMVRLLDHVEDSMEALVVRYEAGDIGMVLAWAKQTQPVPSVDAPIPPEFYEALIDKRNLRMAERALPLLEEGGAFIAVGAAHLPGEQGLVRLLEKAGFRAETLE